MTSQPWRSSSSSPSLLLRDLIRFPFCCQLAGLTLIVLATMSLITINKGLLDQEAEGDVNILYWAAVVMIALGIIMTIIGFLGCCGASRESQCLLGTVMTQL